MHRYATTDEPFDWRGKGESQFDRLAVPLNAELSEVAHHVASIDGDLADGFRLTCDPPLRFEVFPCAATASPKREFWRLLQPATEQRHTVFGTMGARIKRPSAEP